MNQKEQPKRYMKVDKAIEDLSQPQKEQPEKWEKEFDIIEDSQKEIFAVFVPDNLDKIFSYAQKMYQKGYNVTIKAAYEGKIIVEAILPKP